jgi:hypothetical protein
MRRNALENQNRSNNSMEDFLAKIAPPENWALESKQYLPFYGCYLGAQEPPPFSPMGAPES